jgi:zinc/manganese transport system substrate-binding protein
MLKLLMISLSISIGAVSAAFAEPLKVVASFSIIGDIAANIGGDKIEIVTLVGPDSDAHVYEPKPADVATMAGAHIVLMNGLGFEGFMERLVTTSATTATVLEVSSGITTIEAGAAAHHHDGPSEDAGDEGKDPHAFQAVPNVRAYVKNITATFCAKDSENCANFHANAAIYDEQLAVLDAEIRSVVAAIPATKRTVITSHDAFGYLAHEYGLTFIAPEGISTDSEASAADVAKLIDQIREDNASALFVENISDKRLIERIADETGVTIGGTLYSDALSSKDGPASTYIDLMRTNINTIKGAILGS